MKRFKYFPVFPQEARFDTGPCHFCGRMPALDGVWLDFDDDYDDLPPVCVDDLLADKARVEIPEWVQETLARHVRACHPDWDENREATYVAERTRELAHTPPVPWIQHNEWPVCADDYAVYAGQLTRERLVREHGDTIAGRATLRTIMEEERPNWKLDQTAIEVWWERLGGFLQIYTFACADGKTIHIVQTM